MSYRKLEEIEIIDGGEGTKIKQIFHPHNTLNGIRYSISHSIVDSGKRSKKHKLQSSEVYFILKGKGRLSVDNQILNVSKDQAIFIPPLSEQFIENLGSEPLEFLCIVDPAWKENEEQILE